MKVRISTAIKYDQDDNSLATLACSMITEMFIAYEIPVEEQIEYLTRYGIPFEIIVSEIPIIDNDSEDEEYDYFNAVHHIYSKQD